MPVCAFRISIHALLAESDAGTVVQLQCILDFYPRSPCGERLFDAMEIVIIVVFLSTLSLRRATKLIACRNGQLHDFYPRSPCGERPAGVNSMLTLIQFLSTLSLRRATRIWIMQLSVTADFYPRSPCGERRTNRRPIFLGQTDFYPRSPCGERPKIPD